MKRLLPTVTTRSLVTHHPSFFATMFASKTRLSGLIVGACALASLLVSSHPAHAGHWNVRYTRNFHHESQDVFFDSVPNQNGNGTHLATDKEEHEGNLHWYPSYGNPSKEYHEYTITSPAGTHHRYVNNERGHEESTYYTLNHDAGISVNLSSPQFHIQEYPSLHMSAGSKTANAEGELSVTPVLTWVPDSASDTPPDTAYFVEEATVEGYEGSFNDHLFTYSGIQCPFTATDPEQQEDPDDHTDHSDEVFRVESSQSIGVGYVAYWKGQGFNVYQLKNSGHEFSIPGPTRKFSGKIEMGDAYYDEDYVGLSAGADLSFNYTIKPLTLSLSAWPANQTRVHKNKPMLKVIDAEARLALRVVEHEDGRYIRPFWLGQSDFLASATVRDETSTRDIFEQQLYHWQAAHEPVIPVASAGPVEEQTPVMIVGNILDSVDPVKRAWNDLPDWARTTIKLGGQELLGLPEMAVDGRPLSHHKTTTSTAEKYFYWDLGELQSEFPITTETQVVFDSPTSDKAIGPAKARIRWQLPTRTIYDVEIGLWDWTTSEDADNPTWDEWKDRLLTDDDLAKTIAKDTAIEAVQLIPVGRAAGAGKRLFFRVFLNKKVPARTLVKVVDRAAVRITKKGPPRSWWKNKKIRSHVKDAVKRLDPPDASDNQQPGPTAEPTPTQTPEEKKQEEEEEAERESYIAGNEFYLYYQGGDYKTSYWPGGASDNPLKDNWQAGYYLTDMPPTAAEATANGWDPSQVASNLRCGQHSFAMFGHPYTWGDSGTSLSWVKVGVDALEQINGNTTTIIEPALDKVADHALMGAGEPDKTITYRSWPYRTYIYTPDYPASPTSPPTFHTGRLGDSGTVSFLADQPHTPRLPGFEVFDGSPGALDVPSSTFPYPASTRGAWYQPNTTTLWPSNQPVDGEDPGTGLPRRANSDWLPPSADMQFQITGGEPVKYRRGYPDFTDCAEYSVDIVTMKGNNSKDFKAAEDRFGPARGMTDAEVEVWIRTSDVMSARPNRQVVPTAQTPNWVWHHHQDLRHMQLVPSYINTGGRFSGASHTGGAKWSKRARW